MQVTHVLIVVCRPRINEELHGLTYLMETLALILKEAAGVSEEEEEEAASLVPPTLNLDVSTSYKIHT
jgi:hypothetical protein